MEEKQCNCKGTHWSSAGNFNGPTKMISKSIPSVSDIFLGRSKLERAAVLKVERLQGKLLVSSVKDLLHLVRTFALLLVIIGVT